MTDAEKIAEIKKLIADYRLCKNDFTKEELKERTFEYALSDIVDEVYNLSIFATKLIETIDS